MKGKWNRDWVSTYNISTGRKESTQVTRKKLASPEKSTIAKVRYHVTHAPMYVDTTPQKYQMRKGTGKKKKKLKSPLD